MPTIVYVGLSASRSTKANHAACIRIRIIPPPNMSCRDPYHLHTRSSDVAMKERRGGGRYVGYSLQGGLVCIPRGEEYRAFEDRGQLLPDRVLCPSLCHVGQRESGPLREREYGIEWSLSRNVTVKVLESGETA